MLNNRKVLIITLSFIIIIESILLVGKSLKINTYEKLRKNNDLYLISTLHFDLKNSLERNSKILSNEKINENLIGEQYITSQNLYITFNKIIDNSREYRKILDNDSIPAPKINKFRQMELAYSNILTNYSKSGDYKLSSKELQNLKNINTMLSNILNLYKDYNVEDSLQFKIETLTNDKWYDLISKISIIFDSDENIITF